MKQIVVTFASFLVFSISLSGMLSDQKWDGDHYNKYSRPQYDAAIKHLKTLPLESWGEIIDIGCGSGAITAAIAVRAKHASIVGVDISRDMIESARRNYEEKEGFTFFELPAENLVFENVFAGAVSFLTLHWVQDRPAFFTSMFKALKPGGQFFLTAGTKNSEIEALKKKFFGALFAHDPKWKFLMGTTLVTGNNAVSKDELAQWALEAGFADLKISEEIEHHSFESTQDLAQFVGTFISGFKDIAALPVDQRQEFITTAAELWTKVCADGKPSYTWANLVAKGRKPE